MKGAYSLSGVQHLNMENADTSYNYARENAHKCINCAAGFPDKNRLFLHYRAFPAHDVRPDTNPDDQQADVIMPLQVMEAKIESRRREEEVLD